MKLSEATYKAESTANPISPNIFCADPTGVEYEGRLYVYGTNDQQQYEAFGQVKTNSYEQIRSLVVFSTADMANWEYHGTIDVGGIAPWIQNSWAPSIASRVENDGLTHFYLYFSNSGCGVGVLTATHPLGPWRDPLGRQLVWQDMPGLENCPAPFDPGVCIDENGVGWLTFGGGLAAQGGQVHTKVPKIARLGADMLSFDSPFVPIDAPYFFEASELNCVNGTYIYTYSTDWQERDKWDDPSMPAPGTCSMGAMTTRTPLDPDSWVFRGGFFLNAGDAGMAWCNNHTHLMAFRGKRYILHHTSHIEERWKTAGGYRCMGVDELPFTEDHFPVTKPTREGVAPIAAFDPYQSHSGAEFFTCAQVGYEAAGQSRMAACAQAEGAWTYIRSADFGAGCRALWATVRGNGFIEVRLDRRDASPIASIPALTQGYTEVCVPLEVSGVHDVYFAFTGNNVCLRTWQAE